MPMAAKRCDARAVGLLSNKAKPRPWSGDSPRSVVQAPRLPFLVYRSEMRRFFDVVVLVVVVVVVRDRDREGEGEGEIGIRARRISHGMPTDTWRSEVCDTGFSQRRVSGALKSSEIRIERPRAVRSDGVENMPPNLVPC